MQPVHRCSKQPAVWEMGSFLAAPWPLLLFQSSHCPGLRSPKDARLNLDRLSLTTGRHGQTSWNLTSLSAFSLSTASTMKCFHSVKIIHCRWFVYRTLCYHHHINTSLSLSVLFPLPIISRSSWLELTGADLRRVCTGLVLIVVEEIKSSSSSTGWIHVT